MCYEQQGFKGAVGAGWELAAAHPCPAAVGPALQAVRTASPSAHPLPHLWRFLERFAVEAAYSSAINDLIVGWCWLIGLPFELGTVAGFMNHLIIWGFVLGLGFYWFHRLDVRPGSEFIPVNDKVSAL